MWGPRRRGHPQRPPAYDGDDDVDDHHHDHNHIGDKDLCMIGVCLSLRHRNQEFHLLLPVTQSPCHFSYYFISQIWSTGFLQSY